MSSLVRAQLIRRYKRFLADVYLESGKRITVHCPNTGSMKNCVEEGADVWLSKSENPKRKYAYTWEYIQTRRGHFIGINSARANKLVKEGVDLGVVGELQGYTEIRGEVRYGSENSRVDFLLTASGRPDCYVEVKSATLLEKPFSRGVGCFPDAVSERGSKHLRELTEVAQAGNRAMMLFCVQHSGIRSVTTADHIDAKYGVLFRRALDAGVEAIAYKTRFNADNTRLWKKIPFDGGFPQHAVRMGRG